jgi:FixJ family two-component response regulator
MIGREVVQCRNRPLTVAIVDDDDSVRNSLHRLCSAFGLVAATYASARQFLTALADGVPPAHCLVLDAHMPEMSGPELLQHLQAQDLHIPTVVFTADDAPETLIRQPAGSLRYLRKPASADDLRSAIALVTGSDGAEF